ncbi:MAG: tetratricopeptide repeat protein [Xenococcus sp. (in: cyanobacteria)]
METIEITKVSQVLKLAEQYRQDNRLTEAKQIYQQVLEQQPRNSAALYGLGLLAQEKRDLPNAEELFHQALTIEPKSLKIWFSLGNLYYAQTKLPEAEECYLKILTIQPDLVSVYNNLGYVQQQQGKFPEAITNYQKALELQPNCTEADLSLANILYSQGKLPREKYAHYAGLNQQQGSKLRQTGNLDAAITCYQQAIALQPDFVIAHFNLGEVLQQQGRLDEAVSCYQKVLNLQPEAADIHNAIANILQQQDKSEQASDHYQKAIEVRYSNLEIIKHSPYDNIYYCCTQKTASQWFKSVFNDPAVYQYTGLVTRPYVQLGLRYASFNQALPQGTIGTHLYIDYPTYLSIPKPESYKTFFVLRDPRDAVVSWYFSAKYSHNLISVIPELRRDLAQLNLSDGLKYIIDRLEEFSYFKAQRSWLTIDDYQPNIAIFRYEDLVSSNNSFIRKLFRYLNIEIPEEELTALCEKHKFENITKGRTQGEENINSHYRKGISGDWKNYFDSSTLNYFQQVTGDLVEILGYTE